MKVHYLDPIEGSLYLYAVYIADDGSENLLCCNREDLSDDTAPPEIFDPRWSDVDLRFCAAEFVSFRKENETTGVNPMRYVAQSCFQADDRYSTNLSQEWRRSVRREMSL